MATMYHDATQQLPHLHLMQPDRLMRPTRTMYSNKLMRLDGPAGDDLVPYWKREQSHSFTLPPFSSPPPSPQARGWAEGRGWAPSSTGKMWSPQLSDALEVARESEEGARDPQVSNMLITALRDVWAKVSAAPHTYVMSREEFAVFNYFQHLFDGNAVARQARKRYWDHTSGA